MRTPLVYDGRNIYSIDEIKNAGVEYYSIGREQMERVSGRTAAKERGLANC